MTPVRCAVPILIGLSLALAGCSSEAPASVGDPATPQATAPATTNEPSSTADGAAASGSACPTVPQAGYELTSSDAVTKAPEDGQVYGGVDHPIAWTIDNVEDMTVGVDFSYVNDAGDAIPMGGIFLDDLGNDVWGSSLDVFTSDAADRPGFAVLTRTYDASADGDGTISGTTEPLGVYCVTFHVSE